MKNNLPPLLLAYVGDAVFELYVRQKLVTDGVLPISRLHKKATEIVRAGGQDSILRQIEPHLTEEEADIVRRGRNTKGRVPKNADMAAYRRATGFEALLGWLYLHGAQERLHQLFALIQAGEED
ncbi:MAG: Mini-ribonuclease 3 [Dethiobacter sp.]|jgi:ribonuclease-3 family protein|nr:Mini-ribonuclease 3 [Dethiobacter sp.]MBS3897538.1 Mini-ribonuclease 3 [Dethiobacter sp.]MBS3982195.1 Mini-ribonuclease 3 [Dethiobacter sp.]MCL4463329.1 Mini-ribonuclease 3 [Bacillota bacterium]MCL5993541.1 Mini-ribonuclease 3 [Bacillota bacterium]